MEPLTHLLSVYGIAGLTAYFGLLDVRQSKAGETVVVSAAAGAVGSIVGQIAKIKGAGWSASPAARRSALADDELGFDAAVDYSTARCSARCAPAARRASTSISTTSAARFWKRLFAHEQRGRIVCCGAVSQYDGVPPAHGPRGVPGLIVTKRLKIDGFVVMDSMPSGRGAGHLRPGSRRAS